MRIRNMTSPMDEPLNQQRYGVIAIVSLALKNSLSILNTFPYFTNGIISFIIRSYDGAEL